MKLVSRLLLLVLLPIAGLTRADTAATTPEARLAALGLTLPTPAPVVANYVPAVRSGNLVFLAGQIPRSADGKVITGKVPATLSEEQAQAAARTCAKSAASSAWAVSSKAPIPSRNSPRC
jgi:enamine deaminase RidA (YjgF/YER057c/UK114 family)